MTVKVHEDGEQLSLPVPEGAAADEPVKIGALVGVLASDRANTDGVAMVNADGTLNEEYNAGGGNPHGFASVDLSGVFELKVPEAVTQVGQPVYITPDRVLSTSATSNSLFGHAVTLKAVDSGGVEGAVHVKLLRV